MKKELPSRDILLRTLRYDEDSGLLYWREKPSKNTDAGDVAGSIGARGYVELRIDGSAFKAHRLIWKMVHGRDPIDDLDHVDGDRANNSLKNLREASGAQNSRNRKTRRNGLKGISLCGKKWRAQIKIGNRKVHLGCFVTEELAHQAYIEAANAAFGEFSRAA